MVRVRLAFGVSHGVSGVTTSGVMSSNSPVERIEFSGWHATSDEPQISLQSVLDTLSQAVLEGIESIAPIAIDLINACFNVPNLVLLREQQGEWVPQSSLSDEARSLFQEAASDLEKNDSTVMCGKYGCLVPLLPGVEVIFIPGFTPSSQRFNALRTLTAAFLLASAAASRGRTVVAALDEISGLQSVARETLSARELNQVLTCATHETLRLLSANICGVFLKEDEEVVMRSCVGNLRVETAQLRMRRGQGVAGRVFETGEACRVDEYIHDVTISRDYMELARLEHARSALAAPLKIRDEVVGVLEVWRRKKSTFSDRDVRRIMALADLVAIAIHNARLNEAQLKSVEQLAEANQQLQSQNNAFGRSAEIQQSMLDTLLSGEGINGIARIIGRHTGAEVAILTDDMQPLTTSAISPNVAAVSATIEELIRDPHDLHVDRCAAIKDRWVKVQQIIVSGERVGWACIVSESQPDEVAEMALRSGAIACALSYLENRAASQARAELSSEILWDLLEGDPKVKLLAIARAKDLHIDLTGPHRILHCNLDQLEEFGHRSGWDAGAAEKNRRIVLEYCTRFLESNGLKLLTVRGNLLIALIHGKSRDETMNSLQHVRDLISIKIPNFRIKLAASTITGNSTDYKAAHREAAIALLAATKLGAGDIALSDDLGVLGLLLSIRHDSDLAGVVGAILGEVIDYDNKHNNILSKTMRAYFDADCSLQATAVKLDVHQKTVRYRLTHFERLSGMDLRKHENKLMVDLALRMLVIHSDDISSALNRKGL